MTELPWEDSLLERKVQNDLKDLLKTMVAFANSVAPDHTAIILIGEMDDGSIQGIDNPDSIQKKVRSDAEKIYPPILWRSEVYEKEGKNCVRVEIETSGATPHFGAPAWIRRGSVTVKASEEIFQRLIEVRNSKVRELMKWLQKDVTVIPDIGRVSRGFVGTGPVDMHPRWLMRQAVSLAAANQFWATFDTGKSRMSEPLDKLTLTWDDDHDRLALLVSV